MQREGDSQLEALSPREGNNMGVRPIEDHPQALSAWRHVLCLQPRLEVLGQRYTFLLHCW